MSGYWQMLPVATALALAACGGATGGAGGNTADGSGTEQTVGDAAPDRTADELPPPADGGNPDGVTELRNGDVAPAEAEVWQPDCTPPAPGAFELLCLIGCDSHEACGAGNLCLQFQQINQYFCAVAAPPDGCPVNYYSATVNETAVCVPFAGDCTQASLGAACDGEALAGICKADAPHCTSRDWKPGYCTIACEEDGDCPAPYGRCEASKDPCLPGKLCRGLWENGPEGCGLVAGDEHGDGAPCRQDDDCQAGASCIKPTDGATSPFCAASCKVDGDCAAGGLCGQVGGESRCLAPPCQCHAEVSTAYRQLLEAVDLSPCRAGFPRHWLAVWGQALGYDPWRLRRFHELHDFPPHALPLVKQDLAALDEPQGLARIPAAIALGAAQIDRPPKVAEAAALAGVAPAGLEAALKQFVAQGGGVADNQQAEALAGALPANLKGPVADIVHGLTSVVAVRQALAAQLGSAKMEGYLFNLGHGFVVTPAAKTSLPPTNVEVRSALTGKSFDHALLYGAALFLAQQLEAAAGAFAEKPQAGEFYLQMESPAGLIVFAGTGDDLHDPDLLGSDRVALIVDLGGNDTYLVSAGGTVSLDNPASLVIDLGGNDTYGYLDDGQAPPHPLLLPADGDGRMKGSADPATGNGPVSLSDGGRQGSGRMGVGMLVDLGAGKDEYRSLRLSQGCGVFGVGLLYDGGGNDLYQAEALSQGAAVFGLGILIDEGGDDQREGFHLVQGFAYAAAFGLLYDRAGDDSYLAQLGDPALGGYPLYYNPQNPGKSNSSMSQGFGFGRRADFTDGVFMSGGFGWLRDRQGQDDYLCDIFCQAGGYWFGTGILADGEGNDSYGGRWYVLGAGAHYATGIFVEGAGDDTYNVDLPLLNASVGMGHDWSLGIFEDSSGDDIYFIPSLAGGAGNADGIGLFLDRAGNDGYSSYANNTFGSANAGDYGGYSVFADFDCLGLFLDGGGTDSYERPDLTIGPADNSLWVTPPPHPEFGAMELGAGMDSSAIELGL